MKQLRIISLICALCLFLSACASQQPEDGSSTEPPNTCLLYTSIQSSKVGQHLIGLVSKIIRKSGFTDSAEDLTPDLSFNVIKVVLIGTHLDKEGLKENVFRRSLATVPTLSLIHI